jgi:hypothetical protein
VKEEQTAAYTVEIWKRFRKWGGIPTGITQNVKDLLSSHEVENIFENSDFILYAESGSRATVRILAKQLNISPHQLSYVTHSGEGEGLLFYGNVIDSICRPLPEGHRALQGDDDEAGRDNAGGRSKKSAFSRRGEPGRSFPKQRAESRPPDYG